MSDNINFVIKRLVKIAREKRKTLEYIHDYENDIYWIYGVSITILLEYKNTRNAISSCVSDRNKITFIKIKKYLKRIPKNAQPNSIYINETGLKQLLVRSKKIISVEIANQLNYQSIKILSYELCIVEQLHGFCETSGIKYEYQYIVKCKNIKYIIDFYLTDYDIAIEIDEHGHQHYDQKNERIREREISKKMNCRFIRINPNEKDFNIGLLFGRIFNEILLPRIK